MIMEMVIKLPTLRFELYVISGDSYVPRNPSMVDKVDKKKLKGFKKTKIQVSAWSLNSRDGVM